MTASRCIEDFQVDETLETGTELVSEGDRRIQ